MSYIVGDLIKKAKIEKCKKQDFPVLSMTMKDGIVFQNDRFKKQIASIDKSSYNIVKRNQLVVSFPIDEGVLAVQDIIDFGIVSPAYKIWDINDYLVIPKFLEAFLRSPHSIQYYKSKLHGSTARRRTITDSDLLQMEVPLVSFTEQKRILENIRKVKHIITHRRTQLEKLDLLVKARFVEMFGDPVSNPMNWSKMILKELSTKIGSGATPKGGKESYGTEGISLIRSMNVHNGVFEYKDLAYISDEQAEKLNNVTIESDDVLLNITGASVARCCIVPNEILPARVNQHVCVIRCKDIINPIFLNNILIDENYQELLWAIAGSGATREAITKQQVENLSIILPPLELQTQFADFVKQVDKSKVAVQKALDEAQLLFDSLMQEYFG